MGIAALMYVNDSDGSLPHAGYSYTLHTSGVDICWEALLAPYLGVTQLSKYNLTHGIFHCPSQTYDSCTESAYGDNGFYGGYAWNYCALGYECTYGVGITGCESWVKLSKVTRPSNIVMLGDTWDAYRTGVRDPVDPSCVFYLYGDSDRHSGGANYTWVDGRGTWIMKGEFATE